MAGRNKNTNTNGYIEIHPEDYSTNTLVIDPRTGGQFGQYSEEEIADASSKRYATTLALNMSEDFYHLAPEIPEAAVESDPEKAKFSADARDLWKASYDMAVINHRANSLMADFRKTGDTALYDEATKLYDEASNLSGSVVDPDSRGHIVNAVNGLMNTFGYLKGSLSDSGGNIVSRTGAGAAAGFVTGGIAGLVGAGFALTPPGMALTAAIGGATAVGGVGFKSGMFEDMYNQGLGEIYHTVMQISDGTDSVPKDIVEETADYWAPFYAASEHVGLFSMFKAAGVGASAINRINSIATEGGTEAIQSIITQFASYSAEKKWAERRGVAYDKTFDDVLDIAEVQQSSRYGIYSGLGAASLGTISSVPVKVQRAYKEREMRRMEEGVVNRILEEEKIIREQEDAAFAAPLTETQIVEDTGATNTLVKPIPITQQEQNREARDSKVAGTGQSDKLVDDYNIISDDIELDEATDMLLDSVESPTPLADEFMSGLYIALPTAQAQAVESILNARTSALGMTTEEWIGSKGLKFNLDYTNDEDLRATTEFKSQTETVITAYQNADFSSVVHELGHVFVTDIVGKDKSVLDSWVGVKDGARWGKAEHEKFARGWERYLAEGISPTPELQSAFNKFAMWMLNIYKAIKGSSIDVEISPEVTQVFNNMLTRADQAKNQLDANNFIGMTLEQREKFTPRTEEDIKAEALRRKNERSALRTSQEAYQEQLGKAKFTGRNAYGYTTSEGKRHLFDSSSVATRDEKGVSKKSADTVFVTKQDAETIALWKDRKVSGRKISMSKNGIRLVSKRDSGMDGVDHLINTVSSPANGLYAVNLSHVDKTGFHKNMVLSEEITSVDSPSNDRVAMKAHMKALQKAAQAAFDRGDKHGYEALKNHQKAILSRHYARTAMARRHSAIKKRIRNRLSKAIAKVRAGRLQSGMDYNTYTFVKQIAKLIQPIKERDIKRLYEELVMEADYTNPPTPAEVLRNAYLDGAVSKNKYGFQTLAEVYKTINDLIMYGRSNSPYATNMLVADALVEEVLPEINGGNEIDLITVTEEKAYQERKKQKRYNIRQRIQTSTIGKDYIWGLQGLLKMATSYAGEAGSTLAKRLNFYEERQAKMTAIRQKQEQIVRAYMQIKGIKSNYQYNKSMRDDVKQQHDIGTKDGRMWTTSELRQLYMYMNDGRLAERLFLMGITPNVRNRINQVLTNEDKQFADSLRMFFGSEENYSRVNDVYIKMFGVNLEKVDGYVPIRSQALLDMSQAEADKKFSQFDHDSYFRKGPTSARSIKKRMADAKNNKLNISGDMVLFNTYVEETEHFIAYAEKARLAKATLSDPRIKSAIRVEYGDRVYNNIEKALTDVLADSIDNRDNVPYIDSVRSALVVSQIGLSISVMTKQFFSLVNYANKMPVSAYLTGMSKFMLNPIRNINELREYDYIKNRRTSIDRDLKTVMYSPEFKKFQINPTITNFMTLNVAFGDSTAIAIGSWVYADYLVTQINPETGKKYTRKDAIATAFSESETTQQSGAMEELSNAQRGGSYAKLFTMYSTGPVQAIRQELQAIKDKAAGRISTNQLVKTLFIYHVLIPAMYSLFASQVVGDDDAEDTMKNLGLSVFMGPMGSSYAIGRSVTNSLRYVFDLKPYQDMGPMSSTVHNIGRFGGKIVKRNFQDLTIDDYAKTMESLAALFGIGVPVSRVTRTTQNAVEGDAVGTILAKNPNK